MIMCSFEVEEERKFMTWMMVSCGGGYGRRKLHTYKAGVGA